MSAVRHPCAIVCLALMGSAVPALAAADEPAGQPPDPPDFGALVPGESTREAVIRTLGEPDRVEGLYAMDDWVPVLLPGRAQVSGHYGSSLSFNDRIQDRIPREKCVRLRVLRYPEDEGRAFYAAVLRDDVYHDDICLGDDCPDAPQATPDNAPASDYRPVSATRRSCHKATVSAWIPRPARRVHGDGAGYRQGPGPLRRRGAFGMQALRRQVAALRRRVRGISGSGRRYRGLISEAHALARTIADLAGGDSIEAEHVAETVQLRCLDRPA